MKFKVGDKVRVIGNEFNSVNQIGDEGIITYVNGVLNETEEHQSKYRVLVEGRDYLGYTNVVNWHPGEELEIIK